jgi:hypothetical protein
MPTVMYMDWPEVTREQYDEALEKIGWERDVPDGALFHVAWFDESDGFHVVDLWESGDHFNRFVDERLMPAVREIGIQGEPKVRMTQAHRVFAPAYQTA